jgi:NNP family nitrate/nitrite transporter-like MFS transporter
MAVPVIVGSLGWIPVGALTDRLGARRMFPTVALLTVLPVLYLGHFADSLTGYLAAGSSSASGARRSRSASRS